MNRHAMTIGADGRVRVNIAGINVSLSPDPHANELPGNLQGPLLAALCLELAELRSRYDADHDGPAGGLVLTPD